MTNEEKLKQRQFLKDKLKQILIFNLSELYKDSQCDNEDSLMKKAVKQYMEYEFDPINSISLTI